jgi:hypothetical protein
MKTVPFVTIPILSTDKSRVYKKGNTRLDKWSDMYYNTAFDGWLIMSANPEYGGLEFNIPDGVLLRIPYPYESALARYQTALDTHKNLYG